MYSRYILAFKFLGYILAVDGEVLYEREDGYTQEQSTYCTGGGYLLREASSFADAAEACDQDKQCAGFHDLCGRGDEFYTCGPTLNRKFAGCGSLLYVKANHEAGRVECFNVTITTKNWGHENSWTLGTCASDVLGYQEDQVKTEKCCLAAGKHTLTCEDTYKDGWHGGFIAIQGEEYCEDFTNGHEQKQDIDIISSVCENIAGDSTCDRYKANGGYCDHDHYDHWWMEINCRKTCNLCTAYSVIGANRVCADDGLGEVAEDDCEKFADKKNLRFRTQTNKNSPKGCYQYDDDKVYFNRHRVGSKQIESAPICSGQAEYFKSSIGETCPTSQIIDTESECKNSAADVLGLLFGGSFASSYSPPGCYWVGTTAFFNTISDPSQINQENLSDFGGVCVGRANNQ